MALQVAIQKGNTGVVLNYWRILSFSFNADECSFEVILAGHTSAADRVDGKTYVDTRRFHWVGDNNPVTPAVIVSGGAFAAAYAKVKASVPSVTFRPGDTPVETNPFVDAIDV